MKVQRSSTNTNTTENLARWSEIVTTALSSNLSYGSNMHNSTLVDPTTGTVKQNPDQSSNMTCWKYSTYPPPTGNGIVSPAAGTVIDIPHNLPYVPVTIHAQDTDIAGAVLSRAPGLAWTAAKVGIPTTGPRAGLRTMIEGHIYLVCSAPGAHFNVIVA